jgi:hypothetical protein
MNQKKLLTIGGVALGVVVLWKLFGKKSKEKTSSFDGEFSYARGRKRRRMPSVVKSGGNCPCKVGNKVINIDCQGNCQNCCDNYNRVYNRRASY